MPFNGLRFATLEWRNLVSSKVMWVVATAVAIIPLLYGALYLAAFEDPYARLDKVPVAVVNEDRGTNIAGERRVVGDEVVSELQSATEGLGWHFVSAETARKGLADGTYFMVCTIPGDFSQRIASAQGDDPLQASLLVEYDQSANMLASQMGRVAWREVQQMVNASVMREYWETAFSRIASTADALTQAADGARSLQEGVGRAQEGSDALARGLEELSAGASELTAGMDRLRAAVDGVPAQVEALEQSVGGAVGAVESAFSSASEDLAEVFAGLAQAEAALALLSAEEPDNPAVQSLVTGLDQAQSGLEGAAARLESALPEVRAAASLAASDAQALSEGLPLLVNGVDAAVSGASSLQNGAVRLEEGAAELGTGLQTAAKGAGELADRLAEGADEAAAQSAHASERSRMMSDPVVLTESYYTTVRNYGSGFAPYFMALALWVGGLMAGFVFKPLNGRLILAGAHPVTAALANYLPMALFVCVQATLLMLVMQFVLKLQIDNAAGFYAVGYLTALVFAAIMQFLVASLGVPGRFVAIILLMLQLTSSAGTFPVQTTPEFFQVLNPIMPMTYVVEALRQVMSGLDVVAVAHSCLVLAGVGAVCFALTCLVARSKRTITVDDLHPLIQLD